MRFPYTFTTILIFILYLLIGYISLKSVGIKVERSCVNITGLELNTTGGVLSVQGSILHRVELRMAGWLDPHLDLVTYQITIDVPDHHPIVAYGFPTYNSFQLDQTILVRVLLDENQLNKDVKRMIKSGNVAIGISAHFSWYLLLDRSLGLPYRSHIIDIQGMFAPQKVKKWQCL